MDDVAESVVVIPGGEFLMGGQALPEDGRGLTGGRPQ